MVRRPWLLIVLLGATFLPFPARAEEAPRTLRVAVYHDEGTSRSIANVLAALEKHPDLRVQRVKAEDIRQGVLASIDVLVHPGGSGSKQAKTLGDEGREQVRAFVRRGGGFIGICAGAYLATCDYPWSLAILDAKVVDKKHWARGYGDVELTLTPKGRELLGVKEERRTVYYHQGPLLAPGENAEIPDYFDLAVFAGEIARNGAPKGVMPGTTAIAAGHFGQGRVLCFSPHPERTEGLQIIVYRAVRWVAGESK